MLFHLKKPNEMKIVFILLVFIFISLAACTQKTKLKQGNPLCDGIQPPKSVIPFWDISLKQARLIAFRQVDKGRGKAPYRQLLVLIVDEKANEKQTVHELGFTKKDEKRWEESYFSILLKSNKEDAKTLIAQYKIQGFPVTITESKSLDGKETFSKVTYGFLPQVSGESTINSVPVVEKLLSLYQSGNHNKQILLQLRGHLDFLNVSLEKRRNLYAQITNDYLNQFTKEELSVYSGYRMLKMEIQDIRFDMITHLMDNREYYNEIFPKIAAEKKLKNSNHQNADWIVNQALIKSFKTAAKYADTALYEKANEVGQQYFPEFLNGSTSIAKSILRYQIKQGTPESVRIAALHYFDIENPGYYSGDYHLLESGATAVNEVSSQSEEWKAAENWISKVIKKHPNPTRYRLQAELLTKLGKTDDVKNVVDKIKAFRKSFIEFKNFYPVVPKPILLEQENITKSAYKNVVSIPSKYKVYYRYIARESSIYKKGEAIEPIALLAENEKNVTLLTRVHLVTGSILPVTHFRSYYIKSRFSMDGELLKSEYVNEHQIN